jgi:hypothetical protein
MASKRTTHRSSKGSKLCAVRGKKGEFKDIQTYKRGHAEDRFVWRDAKSGRYLDVRVADPHVRPHGVTIEKIKKAVQKSGGGSARKEK